MRPEISSFIRTLTYPDLTDAAKTQGRANVRGVQNDFIFSDHGIARKMTGVFPTEATEARHRRNRSHMK